MMWGRVGEVVPRPGATTEVAGMMNSIHLARTERCIPGGFRPARKMSLLFPPCSSQATIMTALCYGRV